MKQNTQRRMTKLGKSSSQGVFTAKSMVALLVEDGLSRVSHQMKICMWMKTHPHFSTIRAGKLLHFKYIGGEEE